MKRPPHVSNPRAARLLVAAALALAGCRGLGMARSVGARADRVPVETGPGARKACATSSSGAYVQCRHDTRRIMGREVHYQVPAGEPPGGGWPAVFLFQGSFYSAELAWFGKAGWAHGGLFQAQLVRDLLGAGYAVITPETKLGGKWYWDTNVPTLAARWQHAPDHVLMTRLLRALRAGAFGPIDPRALFATGISSGGYMSSRVGIAYPGVFSAIAIQSASYATCSGPVCHLPPSLPQHHPPTLFLHGARDTIVPIRTMHAYADRLERAGIPTRVVVNDHAGHAWIPSAPSAIVRWFNRHR